MYRSVKLMLSLALAGVTLAAVYLTALALGNLLNVSKSSTDAGYPAIAVSPDGQNIGMVWAERYSTGGAAQGPIYLKGSTDGTSLSIKATLDNAISGDDQSWQPDIAVDPITATDMHVVWRNQKNALSGTPLDYIYHARCSLVNSICTEEIVATGTANQVLEDVRVAVNATNQAGTHVVWRKDDSGASEKVIMYRGKKTDDSWAAAKQLSSGGVAASHPAIAVSSDGANNYVHVVWATASTIQYRRGTVDGSGNVSWGTDFSAVKSLPMPNGSNSPGFPAVVAMTDTVVVLWDVYKTGSDPNDYYATYVASTDTGITFESEPRDIPSGNQINFSAPTVHRSDDGTSGVESSLHAQRLQLQATMVPTSTAGITGVVHVVWHETYDIGGGEYRHDVHYGHYAFGGASGSAIDVQEGGAWNDVRLSDKWGTHSSNAYSMSPDIAVDNSGQQFLVYMEGADDGEYNVVNPSNSSDKLAVIDIIYNGEVELVDNTLDVYLPIITKNAP